MTTFEIPTLNTGRLRLRAFQASDLDAYAAMQANPEVMRRQRPLFFSDPGGDAARDKSPGFPLKPAGGKVVNS
jgi:RimJ/RimL family protein N-acetyltransferase